MATPAAPPDRHQQAQEAIAGLTPVLLAQAWPVLDVHDIKGTLPRFQQVVTAIVRRYGRASAAAALLHYRAQRAAAGVAGKATPVMPPETPQDVLASAVQNAVSTLYGPTTPADLTAAQGSLEAEVEQMVLDQGRQAITGSVAQDRQARAWARVPNAGACAFCLMLATRGAVYKTAAGAGRRDATAQWADAQGYTNAYHPNCRCTVEPVFGIYEPTARTREADALWKSSTKGQSGKDALKAFRRAVEGRTDGPTRKQKPRA